MAAAGKANRREKEEIKKRLRTLQKLKTADKATEEQIKTITRLEERLAVIQAKEARGAVIAKVPKEERGKASLYMKLAEKLGEAFGKALGRAKPEAKAPAAEEAAGRAEAAAREAEKAKIDFTHVKGIGDAKNTKILAHLEEKGIKTQEEAEAHIQDQMRKEEQFISKDIHSSLAEHYGKRFKAKETEEAYAEEAEREKAKAAEGLARKKGELEEKKTEAELKVLKEKEEEEARKKKLGYRVKAWGEKAGKRVAESPEMLIVILICAGLVFHYLRYFVRLFMADASLFMIDSFFAVCVGVIIFLKSEEGNPVKRIAKSIPIPVILLLLSQEILLIAVEYIPFLAEVPILNALFASPKFWPWWAIYGIWASKIKFTQLLKAAHAILIFYLIFAPVLSPVTQALSNRAQIARERIEAREEGAGMSRVAAIAACTNDIISGKLSNLDISTCINKKMYPPSEEEVMERTIGRIKANLKEAVTAYITIDPGQVYQLSTTVPRIIKGRVGATSIKKDITIKLACLVNNKSVDITPAEFKVEKSEYGDFTQFQCKPTEELGRAVHKVTVTGDIADLEVNSIVVNYFISEEVLKAERERFITSKDPDHLKIIEQWSKLKASTVAYSQEKAQNYLDQQIFSSYVPEKVQSESDPGYLKLKLMTNRLYANSDESTAVISVSKEQDQAKYIILSIGIENNLKDGRIISVKSGSFDAFPDFLELAAEEDICPMKKDSDELDSNKLSFAWKNIKYRQEKSFLCKLKLKQGKNPPEEITPGVFSLNLNYDYRLEEKGTVEVKRAS